MNENLTWLQQPCLPAHVVWAPPAGHGAVPPAPGRDRAPTEDGQPTQETVRPETDGHPPFTTVMGLELIMPGRTRRGNLAAVEYLLLHHRDDETPQLASKPVCLSTPGHRVIETRRRTARQPGSR